MNQTKEHIIKTSLMLFLRKSYKEVTMKEIVEKTALSKGAFYHYFQSKEELFKEIAHMFFTMGATDFSAFPTDSLKAFYTHYIQHTKQSFEYMFQFLGFSSEEETSLNFFLIMFEAIGRFPEYLQMEFNQYKEELKTWEKVIQTARNNGEIESDASDTQIADLFLYCTDGVFIRFLNRDKKSRYHLDLQNAFDTIYLNLKA